MIQNGVDTTAYKMVKRSEKNKLRSKLGLPLEKIIIISTGAIIKRKRPIKLLKAFSMHNWDDKVLLLMLGDGNLFKKIKKYSSHNIKILGSVPNVVDYLQSADIFVSNSKSEGLPMAMLEAISTGLSIVASDISSHREIRDIVDKKIILFKGQNTNQIAKYIRKSIVNLAKLKQMKNISVNLSCQSMANKYIDYYESLKVN